MSEAPPVPSNLINRLRERLVAVPKPGSEPFVPSSTFCQTFTVGGVHKAGDSAGYLSLPNLTGIGPHRMQAHIYAVDPLCEEAAQALEHLSGASQPDETRAPQCVRLLKDIYDDGQDHHAPGYCGRKGDVVIVRTVRSLGVSHEGASGEFVIRDGEFESLSNTANATPQSPDRALEEVTRPYTADNGHSKGVAADSTGQALCQCGHWKQSHYIGSTQIAGPCGICSCMAFAQKATPQRGCQFDTDGDGNCPFHPEGCPPENGNGDV